jgi:hypothetical protein
MGIGTLLRYLIGSREAILEIAGNRHALWIGLLFVLSAGFAREYDGEDLLNEPWYLVLPLAASLASSFVLFAVAYGIAVLKGAKLTAFSWHYASFLGLFWMTAPLAWLYAIPYERFCTPTQATALNLITLGVVSLWRVALMTRVLTVLMSYSVGAALCLVLSFADVVALILLAFLPFPLISVMGGLHLSEGDRLARSVALGVGQLCFFSLPFCLLGAAVALLESKPAWQAGAPRAGRPRWTLVILAVVSVLIWFPILPFTQPEQQRRRVAEKLYEEGEIGAAIEYMSAYRREAFPPHWTPPGTTVQFYSSDRDRFRTLLNELSDREAAPWVREAYFEVARAVLRPEMSMDDKEWRQFGKALDRTSEGRAIIEEMRGHPDVYRMLRGEPPAREDPAQPPRH